MTIRRLRSTSFVLPDEDIDRLRENMAHANTMNRGWKEVLELNQNRPSMFNALSDGTIYLGVANALRGTPEGAAFFEELVADMSDQELWRLGRGGHDPQKVYAAYAAAVEHTGQPTVILAKTVKGYGMGEAGEGQNITHQQKKMGEEELSKFRDRFNIPIAEDRIDELPFYKPADDSTSAIRLAVMAAGKRVIVSTENNSSKEAATMVPKKSAGTSKPAEPPEPIVIRLAAIFASKPIKARPKTSSFTNAR